MICIKRSFHGIIPIIIGVFIFIIIAFDVYYIIEKKYIIVSVVSVFLLALLILFVYQFINYMYDLKIRKNGYEINGVVTKIYISTSGKAGKYYVWYKYKLEDKVIITKDNLENLVGNKKHRLYFKKNDRIPLITNGKKALINYKKLG